MMSKLKLTEHQKAELKHTLDSMRNATGLNYDVDLEARNIVIGSNARYWFNDFTDLNEKLIFAMDVLYCMSHAIGKFTKGGLEQKEWSATGLPVDEVRRIRREQEQ